MRKSRGFQSISDSLAQDKSLSGLIKRANQLKKLDDTLQLRLPEQVKGMCHLANIRGDTAVLMCRTQMEASKIRMYSRSILHIMQKEFKISVKKLLLKVDLSE
ncbi:DciA family protein [Marinicella sp. S1101]|uniref:DciA family protein n=1 Tax=Marinicella marina TaxID=2996016 RepID=UPI002260A6C1|nr:DciA family protein [Marinicella marina]MCX7554575.1 DciA family protein [Marinicella marina]MDJ1141041.1 DciA family protein [Marinicella marina]